MISKSLDNYLGPLLKKLCSNQDIQVNVSCATAEEARIFWQVRWERETGRRDLLLSTAERTVKRECEMQCGRGGQQYAVCPGRAGVLDAGSLAAGQSAHKLSRVTCAPRANSRVNIPWPSAECRTGNGDKLRSSQAVSGQAISSAVA